MMNTEQFEKMMAMLERLDDQMIRVIDVVAELRDKVEDLESTVADSQ